MKTATLTVLFFSLAAGMHGYAQTIVYSQTSLAGSSSIVPGLFDELGLNAGDGSVRKDFYEIFGNTTGSDVVVNQAVILGQVSTASTAVLVGLTNGTLGSVTILFPNPADIRATAFVPPTSGTNSPPPSGTNCFSATSGFTGCPITITFSPGVTVPVGGQLAFGFIVPDSTAADAILFGTDTINGGGGLSSTTPPYFTGFYATSSLGVLGPAVGNHYLVIESSGPADSDGDGVPDDKDLCPNTPRGAVVDSNGCSIDQLVPCEGPLSGGSWKNHGQYVSAVGKVANGFLSAGLITDAQRSGIINAAARSNCGK